MTKSKMEKLFRDFDLVSYGESVTNGESFTFYELQHRDHPNNTIRIEIKSRELDLIAHDPNWKVPRDYKNIMMLNDILYNKRSWKND